MALSAGTRLGPREIPAPLGAGGRGEAYRARLGKRSASPVLVQSRDGLPDQRKDAFKPMFVMMPTAVSVFEDNQGNVKVARMRLGSVAAMFGGVVRPSLKAGEARLNKAPVEGVIAS